MKKLWMLVLCMFIFCGCSQNETNGNTDTLTGPYLEVKSTKWGVWTKDFEPQVLTDRFALQEGARIRLESMPPLSIRVLSVSEEELHIITDQGVSVVNEGHISLIDPQNEFVLRSGETITIGLPVTDASFHYELTFCGNS